MHERKNWQTGLYIKIFCSVEDTNREKKNKNQVTFLRKLFVEHKPDKQLVSKTYKELNIQQ